MQLVHINVNKEDLENFDRTLAKLKEMGILPEYECRSSIIQDFIKAFTIKNKNRLKGEEI